MVKNTFKRKRKILRTATFLLLTSMLSKLGIGQDLFAELEPISVLFVFVTSLREEGQRNRFRPK